MHIGIDARLAGIAGGHGRHLTQLITHLQEIDHKNSYTIFVHEDHKHHIVITNDNWQKVIVNIPWYGIREQLFFHQHINHAQVDLMHFPHWNVPIRYTGKYIVSIHDLTLLHHPSKQATTLGPLKYAIKHKGFSVVLNHAVKNAAHIITPSNYVTRDVVSTLAVPENKISTIYEGAPKPFDCSTAGPLPAMVRAPYLLYVGVAYPHKNLSRLITSFANYCSSSTQQMQLVLAGKHNYFYKELIRETQKTYPILSEQFDIVFTDYVDDETLHALYCHATALVYPSLSEGFGLPPLEALAHGTPVLSSNATCLPEILENSAIMVNPTDTKAITEGIATIIENTEVRNAILDSAKTTLSRFNWVDHAQATLDLYEQQ